MFRMMSGRSLKFRPIPLHITMFDKPLESISNIHALVYVHHTFARPLFCYLRLKCNIDFHLGRCYSSTGDDAALTLHSPLWMFLTMTNYKDISSFRTTKCYVVGNQSTCQLHVRDCWIHNYLYHQCLSLLTLWVRIPFRRGVLDTALCDKVYKWLAAGSGLSPDTPVSSTNKTDRYDITKILLSGVRHHNSNLIACRAAYVPLVNQLFICCRMTYLSWRGVVTVGRSLRPWSLALFEA